VLLNYRICNCGFVDSAASVPRAVWTPSSQQARQENLCTAEELISSNNLDTNNSSSSATLCNAGHMNSNSNMSWWQQQALQVRSCMKQELKGVSLEYTHFINYIYVHELFMQVFCPKANHTSQSHSFHVFCSVVSISQKLRLAFLS